MLLLAAAPALHLAPAPAARRAAAPVMQAYSNQRSGSYTPSNPPYGPTNYGTGSESYYGTENFRSGSSGSENFRSGTSTYGNGRGSGTYGTTTDSYGRVTPTNSYGQTSSTYGRQTDTYGRSDTYGRDAYGREIRDGYGRDTYGRTGSGNSVDTYGRTGSGNSYDAYGRTGSGNTYGTNTYGTNSRSNTYGNNYGTNNYGTNYNSNYNSNYGTNNYRSSNAYGNNYGPSVGRYTTEPYSSQGSMYPTRIFPALDRPMLLQGGSLGTWSYKSPAIERVQLFLGTEGRPLDTDIELWHGPDNTPCKMRVYVENGMLRPFSAVFATPRGPNTVAIRNIGQIEFPLAANIIADRVDGPTELCLTSGQIVQGGALRTYPFEPAVEKVQVLLQTDGRPLKARIELLQGPNNNKQVIEVYSEDGKERPIYCILVTPGSGNVVRVVNSAPVEFPMTASVVPLSVNQNMGGPSDVVIGGDLSWN